jgi:hypothetical protein
MSSRSDDIWSWSQSDVTAWLKEISLGRYCKQFENKKIDGKALSLLNDEDNLVVVGIPSVLERRHFTREYEKLFDEQRKRISQWDETRVLQFLQMVDRIESPHILQKAGLNGKRLLQLTLSKGVALKLTPLHQKCLHILKKEKLDTLPFDFEFEESSDESDEEDDDFLEEQRKYSYFKVCYGVEDTNGISVRVHIDDTFEKFSQDVLGQFGLTNENQNFSFVFFDHEGDRIRIGKDEDLLYLRSLAKTQLVELVIFQN